MSFGGSGGSSSIAGSADVTLNSPQDDQLLSYSAANSKWLNKTVVTGGAPTFATLPAGSTITVLYDDSGAAYPSRPTTRTDIIVRWRGPTPPIIGDTGAVDNLDEWINTQP